MRVYLPVLISVLVGAVVGGLLFLLPLTRQNDSRPAVRDAQGAAQPTPVRTARATSTARATPTPGPTQAARPLPPATVQTAPPSAPEAGEDVTGDALAAAQALLAGGRLREAQDEFLQVLLVAPDNEEAWAGLVQVRRRLARDDTALLRRQAETYRRAIARGEETEEHYTVAAMRILAQASVRAAQEIEAGLPGAPPPVAQPAPPQSEPSPAPTVRVVETARPQPTPARVQETVRPPTPRPSPRATRRRPTPPVTPRQVSTPVPQPPRTPPPVIVTPAPAPTPEPSLDVNEPFFLIQIGPIYDAGRASEIAADLTVAGYTARVNRPGGGNFYFITLGPYRRSAVEAIVNSIRRRFGASLPVSVNPAP